MAAVSLCNWSLVNRLREEESEVTMAGNDRKMNLASLAVVGIAAITREMLCPESGVKSNCPLLTESKMMLGKLRDSHGFRFPLMHSVSSPFSRTEIICLSEEASYSTAQSKYGWRVIPLSEQNSSRRSSTFVSITFLIGNCVNEL